MAIVHLSCLPLKGTSKTDSDRGGDYNNDGDDVGNVNGDDNVEENNEKNIHAIEIIRRPE